MFTSRVKISCITVSIGRLEHLVKTIRCFRQQTFPNKELIVLTNEVTKTREAVSGMKDIIVPGIDPKLNKGQMKNVACELATGSIICNWEDDHLSHPRRLTTQFQYLIDRKLDAVMYADCLRLFPYYGYLYWIRLGNNLKYRDRSFVQQSIMFRKDLFEKRLRLYDESGERDADEFLIKDLIADGKRVKGIHNEGYQYIQICDGSKPPAANNACDHHWTDTKITKPLSEEEMLAKKRLIDETLCRLSICVDVKTSGKILWNSALQPPIAS